MPKPSQPDLFAASLEGFTPLNGDGPRLWIRRMVIWNSPDDAPIRDITLRKGLNIVWSPDADADGAPMGHGGGKTSFCRLIRYCLGEDSFGTDLQRQRIAAAMPAAYVGAEVMLDGEQWNVIRPIGAGAGGGSHCAIRGGTLESLVQGELPNSTMGPLRQAIVKKVMPLSAPHMPVGSSSDDAWEAALAWMTRDQECRLRDILEWRSSETQSRSPSRNMSKPDRLKVVRLLLKALQQDEIDATRRAQGHKQRAEEATRRKQRVEWLRDDIARNLSEIFGGDPGDETAPDFWANRANAAASAQRLSLDPQIDQKLADGRSLCDEKEAHLQKIKTRLAEIDAVLPELNNLLRILGEKVPRASLDALDASDPRCLSCGQSLPPDARIFIDQQQGILNGLIAEQKDAEDRRNSLLSEQQVARADLALAQQQFDQAKAALVSLQQKAKEAADSLASATGYVTLTTRYPEYLSEITRHDAEAKRELELEANERRAANDTRAASQDIVQRLSELFHMTVQFLIPDGPAGRVLLTENDIRPDVGLHGDLTTAAVDSLKVVAFDLAALLLTMEGKTELPGLWLHDSPREADLGLVIYHRLFELALWLETQTDAPQFQYIVTTTTAPPEKLRGAPWHVLELSSAPSDRRLFRRDL